jgi:hypothetical protein
LRALSGKARFERHFLCGLNGPGLDPAIAALTSIRKGDLYQLFLFVHMAALARTGFAVIDED